MKDKVVAQLYSFIFHIFFFFVHCRFKLQRTSAGQVPTSSQEYDSYQRSFGSMSRPHYRQYNSIAGQHDLVGKEANPSLSFIFVFCLFSMSSTPSPLLFFLSFNGNSRTNVVHNRDRFRITTTTLRRPNRHRNLQPLGPILQMRLPDLSTPPAVRLVFI